jgi:hypothetical protein
MQKLTKTQAAALKAIETGKVMYAMADAAGNLSAIRSAGEYYGWTVLNHRTVDSLVARGMVRPLVTVQTVPVFGGTARVVTLRTK